MKTLKIMANHYNVVVWPIAYLAMIAFTIIGFVMVLPYMFEWMNEAWHWYYGN